MALTYSLVRQGVNSYGQRFVEADVTGDTAYPTGGWPVALASLGLSRVEEVVLAFVCKPDKQASTFTTHGRQIVPDVSSVYAPKLKVYTANNTEAGNASDQSQIVERVRFVGR